MKQVQENNYSWNVCVCVYIYIYIFKLQTFEGFFFFYLKFFV